MPVYALDSGVRSLAEAFGQDMGSVKADLTATGQLAGQADEKANQADEKADDALTASIPVGSYAEALIAAQLPFLNKIDALVNGRLVSWISQAGGTRLGGGWVPAGASTPEHFGAGGQGTTDDTDALIAWMEYGGEMTADGWYTVAAKGPDAGGAYARLLRDVDFRGGPNCRFIAGVGLDNDVLRFTAQVSVYQTGERPSIAWRGGEIDQSLQANSTIIPNSTFYPPIRQGISVTTDGLYIIGYVQIGEDYFSAVDSVIVEGVTFFSGHHWQIAGGDSQLFISGANTQIVRGNEFIGGRDCGFYGSGFPDGFENPQWACEVTGNVCRACNWGLAIKRQPRNLVISGNRGLNTPQFIVFQGLTGLGGTGAVIANNVAEQAWQLVRIDDVAGADVYGNVSINHGPTLADGTSATLVYGTHSAVVRAMSVSECRIHGNTLVSVHPLAAATSHRVVQLNRGTSTFGPLTASNCDVFDNRSFAPFTVVEEISGQADFNNFWGNVAPATVPTPVVVRGALSIDRDALSFWSPSAATVTGTTAETPLRGTTIRARKLTKAGQVIEFVAQGSIAGTANGKRIAVIAGSTKFTMPALTGEGEWLLKGYAINTGTSLRVGIVITTSTGQSFARAGTASYMPGGTWPIEVSGQLVDAADTITCAAFRVD